MRSFERATDEQGREAIVLWYGLGALLVVLYAVFAWHEVWVWDFWTQCAFARESGLNPFTPRDPFIRDGANGISHWPYAVLVGATGRLLGVPPPVALALWGLVNLVAFIAALRRFTEAALGADPELPFYALLFALLAWGPNPWMLSGVFHLESMPLIAAYPSTTGSWLALVTLTLLIRSPPDIGARRGSAIVALSTVTILVHPIPFLFLAAGLMAFALERNDRARSLAWIAVALGGAVVAAYYWPFFPLSSFALDPRRASDPNARAIYEDVLRRIFPALIGAVPLVGIAWSRRRPGLPLFVAALTAPFLFGLFTERWNYGRTLPYLTLLLQLHLAALFIAFKKRALPTAGSALDASMFSLALVLVASMVPGATVVPASARPLARVGWIARHVPDVATVFSDPAASLPLPCFGPKVVVIPYPPFLGADFAERQAASDRFFAPDASGEERREILERWKADYLLFDKERHPAWSEIAASLGDKAELVEERELSAIFEVTK